MAVLTLGYLTALGAWGNEALFSRLHGPDEPQVEGESTTGERLLDRSTGSGEVIRFVLDGVDPTTAPVRQAIEHLRTDLLAIPDVAQVQDPYQVRPGNWRPAVPAAPARPAAPRPRPSGASTPGSTRAGSVPAGSVPEGPDGVRAGGTPARGGDPAATRSPGAGPTGRRTPAPATTAAPAPTAVSSPISTVAPQPVPDVTTPPATTATRGGLLLTPLRIVGGILRPLLPGAGLVSGLQGNPQAAAEPAATPSERVQMAASVTTPSPTARPATSAAAGRGSVPAKGAARRGAAPSGTLTRQAAAAQQAAARAATLQAAEQRAAVVKAQTAALAHHPLVAADQRAVMVAVRLASDLPAARATRAAGRVGDRLDLVSADLPGATGRHGSTQAVIRELTGHVETDLRKGEVIALPLSLAIMVVVFGGLLAAGLPLLGAVASIGTTLAVLLGFSYLTEMDSTVPTVVSVLGLGLCIDYGLLLVSRYREELLHRRQSDGRFVPGAVAQALGHTLSTAGRTVLFSGVTVAVSLIGLLFCEPRMLRAIGAAGISVVLMAVVVALTLVPAAIALAGTRLAGPRQGRRALLSGRSRRTTGVATSAARSDQGAFYRLARRVQRRPALVAVGVALVLVLFGLPAANMKLINAGVQLLPTSSAGRQFQELTAARFPNAGLTPITLVSQADPATVDAWTKTLPALPGVRSYDAAVRQGSGDDAVTVVDVRTTGDAKSASSQAAVEGLREHRPIFPLYVTGETAQTMAFSAGITERAPLAAAVVALAVFVLLYLMTGSVLVPLKAIVMNVVSLGASFGVLVWIFQEAHLEGLLNFASPGGVEISIPPIVLAFAFGLSMDYEVFLLARIKELRDQGLPNDEAVARGLQGSGRIITSAAAIMVVVFLGFAAGDLLAIKELGMALAVAVAVDATLVRILLVPATMSLLGEWNWWAPRPLRVFYERHGLREA